MCDGHLGPPAIWHLTRVQLVYKLTISLLSNQSIANLPRVQVTKWTKNNYSHAGQGWGKGPRGQQSSCAIREAYDGRYEKECVLKKGTVYSLGHTLIVALVLSGQVLSGVDSGKACVRYLYIFSQTPFATLVSEIGRIDEHIYIVSWC